MLSVLVFLPLVAAVLIILLARDRPVLSRNLALGGSGLTALVALVLVVRFNVGGRGYQFSEHVPWLPQIGASYHIGVDGVSLLLVVLTVIVTPVALLVSSESVTERVPPYMALMMLLETGLLGVYLALDLVLFYLFWEAVLIPLYLLISLWGGLRRTYAALKYVLYTMVGSMLMLAGVIGLDVYSPAHTFDIPALTVAPTAPLLRMPLLIAFGPAFAIKASLWPFHSWVPDVYTESATPTTIVLAGAVSKMGVYGFLRLALPLFPVAMRTVSAVAAALAMIGILYGALLALTQTDAKRLVACSSISHMGFILLGVFALNMQGLLGATLQMVNHGVIIAALFAIVAAIGWR